MYWKVVPPLRRRATRFSARRHSSTSDSASHVDHVRRAAVSDSAVQVKDSSHVIGLSRHGPTRASYAVTVNNRRFNLSILVVVVVTRIRPVGPRLVKFRFTTYAT